MRRGVCALLTVGTLVASLAHAEDRAATPTAPTPVASTSTSASAETIAVIGPVLTQTGPSSAIEPLRRVRATDPFAARAHEVELALTDAAQDLSLGVDIAAVVPHDGESELDLLDRAGKGAWVISPRVHPLGSDTYLLRIEAVAPKSNTVLVRVEKVDGAQLAVRAVVM
ncbi:MAG: hypothetical protein ACHREM_29210, partial [Polyangiales bacterium]